MGRTGDRQAGGGRAAVTGASTGRFRFLLGFSAQSRAGLFPTCLCWQPQERHIPSPRLRGCSGEGRGAAAAAGMSIPTGDSTPGGFIPPWRLRFAHG